MPLEVVGEVEDRLEQHLSFAKKEGDEKPSNAPVAVEEGMDCLELSMGQADLDQKRKPGVGVKKPL